MNNSTDSSSPVDINEDSTINYHRPTSGITFEDTTNGATEEDHVIQDSLPKTVREEKLVAVSRLFNVCYRTVIPNRPPSMSSRSMTLPPALSAFNPQPIGKNSKLNFYNNFLSNAFFSS